ncbi:phosphotransferase [Undibacterium flavidum]|uniref:Hydroxylysine kinase n=1 Tax=Undibacterium flavidum TaxID=2762297 RepID=A0ABR6YFH3_9BURK|nr:phosphotransferase [Undibacterium flavidum]MBC3875252.1 phosphotransferase [Undibacterium flavidum]
MQTITPAQALALVEQHWHLSGIAKELPSYADRNFKIHTPQGNYVFKIANPNWSYADLDIENAALLHLAKTCPDLALPQVMLTGSGQHILPYTTASGQACHMRLLSFVEGDIYANVAVREDIDHTYLQTSLGIAIAKLDRGLQDFQHASMDRYVDWSISNLPDLRDEIIHVAEDDLRELVTRHTNYFAEHEATWKRTLPMSVIHNDANDFNVIVAANVTDPKPHVNAIIDFGDMCRHLRIVDLAITIVYALQHVDEDQAVRDCMLAILQGYQSQYPLSKQEIQIMYHVIMARLSQSILMATRAYRHNPANDYILVSQKGVRRLIRQLDAMNYQELQHLFLSVL